jgi:hypothetical protein
MKDELMICPKAVGCNNPMKMGSCFHHLPHKFGFACAYNNLKNKFREKRCPACEKFLGVAVENERRIDGMSEGSRV